MSKLPGVISGPLVRFMPQALQMPGHPLDMLRLIPQSLIAELDASLEQSLARAPADIEDAQAAFAEQSVARAAHGHLLEGAQRWRTRAGPAATRHWARERFVAAPAGLADSPRLCTPFHIHPFTPIPPIPTLIS